jgi:16S rRNA (uracil1498-N3)-methyltransferase
MRRHLIDRVEGGKAFLNENELHHLTRVLRAREGDLFEGLDSHGNRYRCDLRRDGGGWYGKILGSVTGSCESPVRITLAQALIKKSKFEWVVQKAVELGVMEIVPVQTERTEVRLNHQREDRKMQRWQRILEEAVKQSGRTVLPAVSAPVQLEELLNRESDSPCLVMDEEGGTDLKGLSKKLAGLNSVIVLIGPEGGWGVRDRELFSIHSAISVNLGPRILRTETASVVALSLLQYEFGDLGDRGSSS